MEIEEILERLDVHESGQDYWIGSLDGEKVAEFAFADVDGDGRMWLVHAKVTRSREGIGSAMIQWAVEHYGDVWASKARQGEDDPSETRWLTEEGAALINSCVRKGIMKPEWFIHPFNEDDDR